MTLQPGREITGLLDKRIAYWSSIRIRSMHYWNALLKPKQRSQTRVNTFCSLINGQLLLFLSRMLDPLEILVILITTDGVLPLPVTSYQGPRVWTGIAPFLISVSVRAQEIGASHFISACLTGCLPHQVLHLFAAIQWAAQVYQKDVSTTDGHS